MCHDWWTLRAKRREERFVDELRYLFDEAESREPPVTVVEHEREERPADPERREVEVGTRA